MISAARPYQPPVEIWPFSRSAICGLVPGAPAISSYQCQYEIHDSERLSSVPVCVRCSDSAQPIDAYAQQFPIDWFLTLLFLTSVTFSSFDPMSSQPAASGRVARVARAARRVACTARLRKLM